MPAPTPDHVTPIPAPNGALDVGGAMSRDFGSFYQGTLSPLRRYLSRFLGSPHDAQDIAHDAYLKTYKALELRPVAKPEAYLFTIARNLAINHRLRILKRYFSVDEQILDECYPADCKGQVERIIENEEGELFDDAMRALTPSCRQVLALRLHEGLSYAEIAGKLRISERTVAAQLGRAFRDVRAHVKKPQNSP